jgi:hypothetical protein
MELDLQSLFGLYVYSCTHWLRPLNFHPPPAFWLIYEGAIARIDDTSLKPPEKRIITLKHHLGITDLCMKYARPIPARRVIVSASQPL